MNHERIVCSFCQGNHEIYECNHEQITNLEKQFVHWTNERRQMSSDIFMQYLGSISYEVIESFAVKYGWTTNTESNIYSYIYHIFLEDHFSSSSNEYSDEEEAQIANIPELGPMILSPLLEQAFYREVLDQWIRYADTSDDEDVSQERLIIKIGSSLPTRKIKNTEHRNTEHKNKDKDKNKETKEHECGICYDNYSTLDMITLCCERPINHKMCSLCFIGQLKTSSLSERPKCPFCRHPIYTIIVENDDTESELRKYIH